MTYTNPRSGSTPATTPTISSGGVVPATTPTKIGDLYINTALSKLYYANGTASSADWIILN